MEQAKTTVAAADEQVVVFQLGKESYGVGISLVDEIKTMSEVTRVPRAPDYVEGIINFRGRVTPVVDVRRRFGMESAPPSRDTRIIVVSAGELPVGLIVDSVSEVLRVPAGCVEAPSSLMVATGSAFVRGIAKISEERLVILLDHAALVGEVETLADLVA